MKEANKADDKKTKCQSVEYCHFQKLEKKRIKNFCLDNPSFMEAYLMSQVPQRFDGKKQAIEEFVGAAGDDLEGSIRCFQ